MSEDAPVNTGAPGLAWPDIGLAQERVLKIQAIKHVDDHTGEASRANHFLSYDG